MNFARKSETIQLRVTPAVKHAAEKIFWRLGLRMSDAVEVFLRQVIMDERLPFSVRALNDKQLRAIGDAIGMPVGAETKLPE